MEPVTEPSSDTPLTDEQIIAYFTDKLDAANDHLDMMIIERAEAIAEVDRLRGLLATLTA